MHTFSFKSDSPRSLSSKHFGNSQTDSFLNVFRGLVCRRGPVPELRCDRRTLTNFVGAIAELQKCLQWTKQRFGYSQSSTLAKLVTLAETWEGEIRTLQNVLNIFHYQNGSQSNDESLHTNFVGASAELQKCLNKGNGSSKDGILSKFNTPKASHIGGFGTRGNDVI